MNNFDSLKLQFSKELISFDPENYNKTTKVIEGCETTEFHLRKGKKKIGIKNIIIKDQNCTIEMSSKLIPDLYYNMINVATIDKYLNEINKPELIQFNTESFIYNSNVLTCDVTNNLKVSGDVQTYVNGMLLYKLNNKYKTNYNLNESIIFERSVKTSALKQHITIYNKYPELLLKRNAAFRDKIRIEDYKNILRVESRYLNFELMRTSFKSNDNNLYSLLNSKEKINYNILDQITDIKEINIESFNLINSIMEMKKNPNYSYSKIRNLKGDMSILNDLNFDIDFIRLFFSTNSNANNSKYIKHFKQLIKFKNDIDNKDLESKVSEIKKLLAA